MTIQQRPKSDGFALLLLPGLLMLAPFGASATALGEPAFVSRIGEPLRVEIPLLRGDGARAAECLRLPSGQPGTDGIPYARGARLSVTGRGDAARVVVSHRLPSYEPILRFAVEDTCDSRLRREYTVLLAFPDQSGSPAVATRTPSETDETDVGNEPARPARSSARGRDTAASTAAPPTASDTAPSRRTRPAAPALRQDRLELGGGESELPGAGLRLSTQLGSLARVDVTTDAQREQLRREQSVIMAIDRTIVAQLELNERIRQLEAIQERMMAEARLGRTASPAAAPVEQAREPAAEVEEARPAPVEPDHSVAEAWKRGTLTVGFVSLALAAALAWLRRRRQTAAAREEDEHEERVIRPRRPPVERASEAPRMEPRARPVARAPEPPVEPAGFSGLAATTAADPDSFTPPAERSPLGWETAEDAFAHPVELAPIDLIAPIAPSLIEEESAEEHESAIELAEIMMGFGRIRGAADTLAEFIASNPKKAVTPWLKLMEVYRAAALREEFDALAQQLNKTFNVKAVTWDSFDEARQATQSMEQMAHVTKNVQQMWGTPECQAYLEHLLRDNRDGTREGFPLSVIDEILLLEAVLEDQLGPYRPPVEPPAPPQGDSSEVTQLL